MTRSKNDPNNPVALFRLMGVKRLGWLSSPLRGIDTETCAPKVGASDGVARQGGLALLTDREAL
jgi:hypothetical protein